MAKIVGIVERLGAAGIRARDVRGVGNYEAAAPVTRHPYQLYGFGATAEPYDLAAPGRVAEIKRLLIALGQHESDPNLPDHQIETTFRDIDLSPGFEDAWDGPTADAFALAAGRHKRRMPAFMPLDQRAPLIQLPRFRDVSGNDVVVGGPQPTVAGLEALAQAAHEVLKDAVQLDQYLAWRGGVLDCVKLTTDSCTPPDTIVKPTRLPGRPWDQNGWTVAWRDGPAAKQNPDLLSQLDLVDQSLQTSWMAAPLETSERRRKIRADALRRDRLLRHNIVLKLNAGAAIPDCPDPATVWSKEKARCVLRCPSSDQRFDEQQNVCVVDVSPVTFPDYDTCLAEMSKVGDEQEARDACEAVFPPKGKAAIVLVATAAVLGLGGYFLFRDKKIPTMATR